MVRPLPRNTKRSLNPDDKAGLYKEICEPTPIEATDDLDGNRKVMGRRGVLGLFASGAATLLSGCLKPHEALRYRLMLEVRTPEGIKTGSSVLQNDFWGASIIPLPGDIGGSGYIGEAPTVDLGGGRFLFALLCGPDWQRDVFGIVSAVLSYSELKLGRPDDSLMQRMKKANETKPSAKLGRGQYPILVTFTDVNEPKSVIEVARNDLAASFGAGYALEEITFQVVDQQTPLTTGIRQRLKWLGPHPETRLDQQMKTLTDRSLARTLFNGCFVSGATK